MTKIKGWIGKLDSRVVSELPWKDDDIYIEEIPPNAVSVYDRVNDLDVLEALNVLPAHLRGKKVEVIIIPIEEVHK